MEKWNARLLSAAVILALLGILLCIGMENTLYTVGNSVKLKQEKGCVVIDAGHGGSDPGKIGTLGTLEKDLNLEIAFRIKAYLEASDVAVIMTREADQGLDEDETGNKKVQDMKERIHIMEDANADAVISIHQNSYPEETVKGAQVFYYTDSTEGKRLAEILQGKLIELVDPANTRRCKGNTNYYLLKKTTRPTAIVECGFLSCPEEEKMLLTQEYRDRVAWACAQGILNFLKSRN